MPRTLEPVIQATLDAGKAKSRERRYVYDQWKHWTFISEPEAFLITVTTPRFPEAMKIAKALHAQAVERGMTWVSATKGYTRTENGRGIHLVHRGRSFAIKIAEGYRQMKSPEPYVGTGIVRVQIDGFQRWEPGPRKGSVVDQVPRILDWIEVTVAEREAADAERVRLDALWEEKRDEEAKKRLDQWRKGQLAHMALAEAKTWRDAQLMHEYAEALRHNSHATAETREWATRIESIAVRMDPLQKRPAPKTPDVPEPNPTVFREIMAGLPASRPWKWEPED